jgi:hypothetical protein
MGQKIQELDLGKIALCDTVNTLYDFNEGPKNHTWTGRCGRFYTWLGVKVVQGSKIHLIPAFNDIVIVLVGNVRMLQFNRSALWMWM